MLDAMLCRKSFRFFQECSILSIILKHSMQDPMNHDIERFVPKWREFIIKKRAVTHCIATSFSYGLLRAKFNDL